MKTHFCRRTTRLGSIDKLSTPQESAVYSAAPSDRLVTLDEFYELVRLACRKEGIHPPPRPAFASYAIDLAQRGFLYEVHPARIERMLSSI